MMNGLRSLKLAFSILFAVVAIASIARASNSFVDDYRACSRFLKMTPAQQRADFIPGQFTFSGIKSSCRAVVRRGLKDAIAKDRAQKRSERDSNSGPGFGDPGGNCWYDDQCPLGYHCNRTLGCM